MISTIAVALVLFVTQGLGRPKYIAIPLDEIEFVESEVRGQPMGSGDLLPSSDLPLVRIPRRQVSIADVDEAPGQNQEFGESRVERQSGGGHHHPYVDYGAHTGHKGAFGWYADFPVLKGH